MRNFKFRWNLKRREILKCHVILNIAEFKCLEILNASKILSLPCVAFESGAVSQDIRRMLKLR
ncbi:hypothetical protein, partial [uncultured Campylobacter sp.]|uniref:hypothetical protein n=1 Tax=uncultured Campylobacter sp. TaxID=218934 RepID=UPI00262417D7